MAIQDDNTIVTKGDLKALYTDKIAPYLGANMMMSTNTSDYYSTDEKVVGVWTDGKPLYQKTARYTITSRAEATILNMPIDLANLDSVVNVWGTGSWSGGYYLVPLGAGSSTVGTVTFGAVTSTYAQLRIGGSQAISAGEVITFTVQYTKTTDTAGSALTTPGAYDINFPNTWPTNKEIFFGNGLYGYRFTGTTGTSNTTFSVSSNIRKIISYGGYITTTINNLVPIGSYWTSTNYISNPFTTDNNFVLMYSTSGTSYANKQADIWVTYTK